MIFHTFHERLQFNFKKLKSIVAWNLMIFSTTILLGSLVWNEIYFKYFDDIFTYQHSIDLTVCKKFAIFFCIFFSMKKARKIVFNYSLYYAMLEKKWTHFIRSDEIFFVKWMHNSVVVVLQTGHSFFASGHFVLKKYFQMNRARITKKRKIHFYDFLKKKETKQNAPEKNLCYEKSRRRESDRQ